MPFYHAIIRPGLLDVTRRQQFAQDVVEVHCDVTGAPPSFVHVLVTEDHDGRLPEGQNGRVAGTIRSGRTDAQKADLCSRLDSALAARAAVDRDTVSTATTDIDASYTMEGGSLLPEPGSPEEEAWKLIGSSGTS